MSPQAAMQDSPPQGREPGWLDGYTSLDGAWDECVAADGTIRLQWRDVADIWSARGAEGRAERRRAADRYLRDSGVGHRVYGDEASTERPWPLSHVPLIMGAEEWQALERGLVQRAELLERIVADIYGPQSLIKSGHLPASLVAASPGFLRPVVGIEPRGGHHLHVLAVELGRGPEGRWWVLGDRTQAPSGFGYALENRLALSRAQGEDLTAFQVQRVAPFFQTLRAQLNALSDPAASRVALLTPGPFNETYYEQALLARYLGLLLLEGGDLTIRDDALFVRTVRGLRPIDALWRRLDADYCDPLELRAESQIGVPGMVRAVRAGKLTTINSLGSGVLESRFLMAFLPTLARELLGEDLQLPSIATWWLGDDAAREQALGAGASTVTLTATGSSLPVDDGHLARDAIDPSAAMGASRFDAVAQEVVRLSTLPARARPDGAGDAGPLVPKPVSLRVFLVRHETGWSVMPGGFCRVGATPDPRALSMQRGSRSADVWIRSEAPVAQTSLLPQPGKTPVKRVPGTLPARAADNLFWLGRYTERAQLAIRLARAYTERRLDGIAPSDPIVTLAASQLRAWGVDDPEDPEVFETSLVSDLRRAHQAASAIRDRFSPDAWQGLNRFVARFESGALQTLSPIERLDAALAMLASFAGLISENMVRLSGWRFLEIGRRLERAFGTCQAIETFGVRSSQAGALELLLELADSVMSYRQRYAVTTDRQTVADLVMLDPNNPRSVAFQLERIHLHVNEITDHKAFDQTSALQKRAFSAWSVLHTASAGDVDLAMIKQTQSSLLDLSGAITTSYLSPALASEKVGGGA